MVSTSRTTSMTGRLTRLGFSDVARAAQLCGDKDLVAVVGEVHPSSALLPALAATADPDLALIALIRLCCAATVDPDHAGRAALLGRLLSGDTEGIDAVYLAPTSSSSGTGSSTSSGRRWRSETSWSATPSCSTW